MAAQSLRRIFLFPLILLVLVARPVSAQFSGAIQGTITDSQKAVVAGATVIVTHVASGVSREVTTSSEGVFRVVSLGPGAYRVQVVKPGFVNAERDAINVGISETVRVDVTLDVSGVQENLTVTTHAPLVETEQGRVSGRVDRLQLQELPLSGRNLYNLIALQPGVTGKGVSASISGGGGADDSFAGESAPRINASGQRDEANSFTVDDTSTNGVARGGITNLTPNTESVEEVRVVANNFSAVDGRNTGAQIQVITKAGTNQFRGSGSYYFQNDSLSARNTFEAKVPEFSKHQFGYSFGGPIVRNQLFFFTSYEGLRQSGARGSTFTVETPEFRNFVLARNPNSIAALLLRDFAPAVDPTSAFRDLGSPAPGANVIGPPDGIMDVGSAFFVPEGWRRGNQFNLRSDYELRPGRDRLYGNFYRTNSYAVTGGIRPAFNRPTPNTTHFGNINYTHTFSSSKLNELRAGVMRLVGLPDVPLHLEIPGITITGATGFGQSGYPNGWWQTNWHFKDIFTVVKSTHQVKMGGELRQMYGSATNTNNYIPAYSFTSLLNFADDEALQMTRYVDPRTGEPVTAYSELAQTEWAIFVDDSWKVTSNLTINAGLRYENYGTFRDTDDTLRNLVFGPGAAFEERLASARVDFVDKLLPVGQQQRGAPARIRVGSEGRRQDVHSWRLRPLLRSPDESPCGELQEQPAAARDRESRPVFWYTPVHLQPWRCRQAVSRLPGRSCAPGRSRLAQWNHRRAGRPHHRGSRSEESIRSQLVRRRPARALARHCRRRELRRIGRPEPAQRIQHQSLRRRPDRRPIRRLQSELRPGQHGHLDVDLRLQRRHADAATELRAGVHAAGGLHVRAREGRCGSCSGDDELPGRSRSAGRAGAGELRRDAQARDGRRLADAVLQGQHRHHEECAGGLATRRVCDPSDRDADQHHQWGVLSSG